MARSKSYLASSFEGAMDPPGKGVKVRVMMDSPSKQEKEDDGVPLAKSILDYLNDSKRSVERLAFETDPQSVNQYQAVYRAKLRLLPDALLKRILINDDLVAAIVRARETQMSSFGRPRDDRHETGYTIEANPGVKEKLAPEELVELDTRIQKAVRKFWTCGSTEDIDKKDYLSFAQWLQLSVRNAIGLGRLATEIIYVDRIGGSKEFHHFRPVDAGTIYKATPQKTAAEAVRRQAMKMLQQIRHPNAVNLDVDKYEKDEYEWIQVINNLAMQAFTDDQLRVHNFFPVLDVELDGYPVTPIDTMISAVTTHINITTHNKIYFQTGRAARGMLVFKSDDVDEHTLQRVKQQFNASINSVNNAWRMPVFAIGTNDEISWESIDNSSRDAEFQYLTDMNARVILSAFQMSPDELPGWAYLSRGTNNQSLSESNNEYRMEAARDQGIRPLIAQFEDFINGVLFPLIDPSLAKLCKFKLRGLDALTEEKESVALQTNMPIHMTYDQVMQKVEKEPLGAAWGGTYPLNPQIQAVHDKYLTVGMILEKFFGMVGASKDPMLNYRRDPFWFNQVQMVQAQQQQAQAAQQQAAGGGGEDGGAAPNSDQPDAAGTDGGPPEPQTEKQKTAGSEKGAPEAAAAAAAAQPGEDLTRSIDQALYVLSKSEDQLPPSKKKLLTQHRLTMANLRNGLDEELRAAAKEIRDEVEKLRRS